MYNFLRRMIGAARLNAAVYEEVEADSKSTAAAIAVVVISSIAAGLGTSGTSFVDIVGVTVAALASWMIWIGLTYVIGTKVMPSESTQATIGQVLRTTGFSAAPGVLRILGGVPLVGWPIFVAVNFWMLFSFVIAVRQALDYSSFSRALAVCILGWLIHGLIFFGFVMVAI